MPTVGTLLTNMFDALWDVGIQLVFWIPLVLASAWTDAFFYGRRLRSAAFFVCVNPAKNS